MSGYTTIRNQNLRVDIDQYLATLAPGTQAISHALAKSLSDGRRSLSSRNVGNILRERDDVRWVDDGVWQKVPV